MAYQQDYEDLRNRMDRTMRNLNTAQNAARSYKNSSPLRSSMSPKNRKPIDRASRVAFTEQQPQRSYGNQESASRMNKDLDDYEPIHIANMNASRSTAPTQHVSTAVGLSALLKQVDDLQRERDHFANEAFQEKTKNQALEQEFHTLRQLIKETQKPIVDESVIVRNSYNHERELRINADNDVSRLRQQLADTMGGSHRDITNLKKALTDMQHLNNKNLQTIYEKGDQNLAQMQQLEDLSQIIRQKELHIEEKQAQINDLTQTNRNLHENVKETKQEMAALQGDKGKDMMMNSSAAEKMKDDPRFRAAMGLN